MNPYRNARQDVADAKEYMRESYDVESEFDEKRKTLSLNKVLGWDDYSSWGSGIPESFVS